MGTRTGLHVAPTLLCANQLQLERDIEILEKLPIRWHHVDVMDGHFVPNLAFGMDAIAAIKERASKPVMVHLMVTDPERYIERLADLGIEYCVFHVESTRSPFRLAQAITDTGMKPGVAISPSTPIEATFGFLHLLSVVVLMAVEPGFSGQAFLEQTYARIRALRERIEADGVAVEIEVDGGVDDQIASECVACGADVVVGGAFTLFRAGNSIPEGFERLNRAILADTHGAR